MRGPGLTDNISSTDPLKDNLPLLEAKPLDESREAIDTAKLVNELSIGMHTFQIIYITTQISELLIALYI